MSYSRGIAMIMKKLFISILFTAVLVCGLCGCTSSDATIFEFTYQNAEAADMVKEKSIYFNENQDSVILNMILEIDGGTAKMQVFDKQNNQVIWEKTADKAINFDIEMEDFIADHEYIFRIETEQAKYVYLQVTSSEKLVKEKGKPEIK